MFVLTNSEIKSVFDDLYYDTDIDFAYRLRMVKK